MSGDVYGGHELSIKTRITSSWNVSNVTLMNERFPREATGFQPEELSSGIIANLTELSEVSKVT